MPQRLSETIKAFLPVITKELGITEIYGICLAENNASLVVMDRYAFENVFRGIGKYHHEERENVRNVWESHEFSYMTNSVSSNVDLESSAYLVVNVLKSWLYEVSNA